MRTVDTFKLSQQTMKVKGAKHSSRRKEDAAVSQALHIARTGKGDNTQTVRDCIERSRIAAIVKPKEKIKFSGKYAHSYVFGNTQNTREAILEELSQSPTKTRAKKLRAQLRDIDKKITTSQTILGQY